MTIDYGAFDNCVSLKEIIFNGIKSPVVTNISKSNNLPKDFKIIVPDEVFDEEVEIELLFNYRHVISLSSLKIEQFKKDNTYANVYFAIACLENIDNINIVASIIKLLRNKYLIDILKYEHIKTVLKRFLKYCHVHSII